MKNSNSRRIRVLDDDDSDPMLSAINLVDVFLVAMVILMLSLANRPAPVFPLPEWDHHDLTVIRDAGKPTMSITIKRGEKLTRFDARGGSSDGNGTMAGTAYRMHDGTMVYVPTEDGEIK